MLKSIGESAVTLLINLH